MRFGKAAVFWLMLGMLALTVLAATPWLRSSSLQARGPIAALLGDTNTVEWYAPAHFAPVGFVLSGLLLIPTLALILGWALRATNGLSRLLTYVAALAASGLTFVNLHYAHLQYLAWQSLQQQAAQLGDSQVLLSWGPQLPVALAASALAASAFVLAAFALHRRWWSRVIVLVLLGLPLVSGSLWTLRSHWLP